MLSAPALAQAPGWTYSPLPGEGDRASLGCATGSSQTDYVCLAVRCEDDFSVGIHIYTSRKAGAAGSWQMTLDRENRVVEAHAANSPYGALVEDEDGWLLDRLQQGTFVYLRHDDDTDSGFAHISLAGSYRAIREALFFCAPRVAPGEQNAGPNVPDLNPIGERK